MSKIEVEGGDEYLTTAEVVQRTRTPESFWEKLWITGGSPQFSKPARFARYRWQDVAEFMESKTRCSTSKHAQAGHRHSDPGCLDEFERHSRGDDAKNESLSDVQTGDEA